MLFLKHNNSIMVTKISKNLRIKLFFKSSEILKSYYFFGIFSNLAQLIVYLLCKY